MDSIVRIHSQVT